jgi:DtxR family Mn-dependent transcriptional regulator
MSGRRRQPAGEGSVSTSVGDYLKAVWSLGRDGPVTTGGLAARLGVAPASVSGMVVRLHRLGLLAHVPYHGVSLTAEGNRQALRLVRRHRLLETFLVERLGYAWDEVHAEAEVLEHAVSDRFIDRLSRLLGEPTHDPHGDPIPTAGGAIPPTPDQPLTAAADGTRFRVHRLHTQDPEALARLDRLGLKPGVDVRRFPGGTAYLTLQVSGRRRRVPLELARLVHGEPIPGPEQT